MENRTDILYKHIPVETSNGNDAFRVDDCIQAMQDYANQQVSIAVEKTLQIAEREAWLIYHNGTTKTNTHGQKQINIGNNHIKIDPLSINTLVPQILKELKGELT